LTGKAQKKQIYRGEGTYAEDLRLIAFSVIPHLWRQGHGLSFLCRL
jgi:hypothetical protein